MAVSVKQPGVSKYFKTARNNVVLPSIGNFFIDTIRNSMNRGGDVADYLVGKPARNGFGIGDVLVGRAPAQPRPKAKPPVVQAPPPPIPGPEQIDRSNIQKPETISDILARYMAMANGLGLGGNGSGTDYSALTNQLRSNAAQGDARLAAMYNQLQNSFKADAPGIAQNFDSAGNAIGQNAAAATAGVNSAYQAARDAQTKQLAALGIGDAAAVLASNGGLAARDQAAAASNIQQNQAANANQNTQQKTSALNYNTGIANAAQLEGATQRATLQQQLANKLAELQTQQGADRAAGKTSVFNAALQLMQMDPNNPSNIAAGQSAQAKTDLQNQMLAAQLLGQQLKNQNFQATTGQSPDAGANFQQLQKMFVAAGGDPADQDTFGKFVQQMVNAGKVKLG